MTIFGVDPGTERTGYGIVQKQRGKPIECISYGCITTPRDKDRPTRLLLLEEELSRLLKHYKPDALAVESLFFFKNLKTVMPVSEAKGVILLSGARAKVPIYEFTPLQVKMAIAGYGRAEKAQVQRMVKEILGLSDIPKPDDAADGLGIAIACSLVLKG